jgi:hypothetical protein
MREAKTVRNKIRASEKNEALFMYWKSALAFSGLILLS